MKHGPTLIDTLYRASFRNEPMLSWKNNAVMREHLVNAKRFMLDDSMSSFLGDLASAAFANDNGRYKASVGSKLCEQLRISARLPHRAVWIEYNLREVQRRSSELFGRAYAPQDSPLREGWLLQQHPSLDSAISMHIFTQNPADEPDSLGFDTWAFPVMYAWTVDDSQPPWPSIFQPGGTADSALATGILPYVSHSVTLAQSPLLRDITALNPAAVRDLVREWIGVMRRAWALLATLNDIPVLMTDVRQQKGFLAKGRIRKFLDHTTIKLNVPAKKDTRLLARQLVAIARRRAHDVRAHWRRDWRNPGRVGCEHVWSLLPDTAAQHCALCGAHRLWIHEHQRGDAAQGFTSHNYTVHHDA